MKLHTILAGLSVMFLIGLAAPPPAAAQRISEQPSATLLLPYFEVDLERPTGVTTLFSINNASATAVLAHVTVWSDLAVPVMAFNIYLTGYDVATMDMRSIINGTVPRTASAGQDPTDTISNKGDFSQDINFASCSGILPTSQQSPEFVSHMRASLTGGPSAFLGGRCAGLSYGDNVARGFVTVDAVNNCTLRFPGEIGYFGPGGTGDATNQNVMWGDYFFINRNGTSNDGDPLVHIRAAATDPELSIPGNYTFYGRLVNWAAFDNREPLATKFATRYISGGVFNEGTSISAWRDPKVNQIPFTCGSTPSWYPLSQESLVAFSEQEEVVGLSVDAFPAAAQRVKVGSPNLPVPFTFGWLYTNLSFVPAVANPPEDPLAAQGWMTVHIGATSRFSMGYQSILLDSATQATHGDNPTPAPPPD